VAVVPVLSTRRTVARARVSMTVQVAVTRSVAGVRLMLLRMVRPGALPTLSG